MRIMQVSPVARVLTKAQVLIDRARGLDFITAVEPTAVGLDPERSHRSTPSGDRYLRRVLDDCNILPTDSIVDVGCGKGSALRAMLSYPFASLCGIELSPELARIAARNFATLKEDRVRIVCADAADFVLFGTFDFIYFYNPFPSTVMRTVMHNIAASNESRSPEKIVVYNNPTCSEIVQETGGFALIRDYPARWGNRIAVYSSRPPSASRLFAERRA